MEVGLALPQYDWPAGDRPAPVAWSEVLEQARTAERLGLDSLWVADHLYLVDRYGGTGRRVWGYDPLVALAGLARATRQVKLGTLVLCVQMRPARLLAKALASIDALAGGRLVIGLGAGWNEPEYVDAGIPFERPGVRLRQLAQATREVAAVLEGGPPSVRPASPQVGRPKIVIGGKGDQLLRVVAEVADGWNAVWQWTPGAYAERLAVLHRACDVVGRDPSTVDLSLGLYTLIGEDESDLRRRFGRLVADAPAGVLDGMTLERWRQGRLVGTVAEVSEQLHTWAALGVRTLVACPAAVPFGAVRTDDLEALASAVPKEWP